MYVSKDAAGRLLLLKNETVFEQHYPGDGKGLRYYTITWNHGPAQKVIIDEVQYEMPAGAVLPIMMNQAFRFEHPEQVIAWQFNREFYCVVNHDAEVGCVGFVFYGPQPVFFIHIDEEASRKMEHLLELFEEEMDSEEEIKGEMLRMLLVRLIINITRLAKKQYLGSEDPPEKFNLVRQYHLLVEIHYQREHQVQYYAGLLNRSPKTLSNIFSVHSKKTPLQVIQERIILEARRLFLYTDLSVKEIATRLGFEDVSHFSRFFKNQTAINPSDLRKSIQQNM